MRRLSLTILTTALLAGSSALLLSAAACSAATDFDGGTDGGVDTSTDGAPDGADSTTDSTIDGLDTGVGDAGPDAGPSPCPEPCFGDLTRDAVDAVQRTGVAGWRYLADTRSTNGLDYAALRWGGRQWEGSGAVIGRCGSACSVPGAFRFDSTTGDATVELLVAARGVYRLGGTYEVIDGVSQELLISRDGRNDALFAEVGTPGTRIDFDREIFVETHDRIRITLRARGGLPAVVAGVRLWISGPLPGATDACEIAVDFDADPWVAQCGGVTPMGTFAGGIGAPPTREMSSVGFGDAVNIDSSQSAYLDVDASAGLDLSGDFTIQLWGRYDDVGGTARNSKTLFSNFRAVGAVDGEGIAVAYDPADGMALAGFGPDEVLDVSTYRPAVMTWQFFRVVREGGQMRLCVDGVEIASVTAGARDFTSTRDLFLGYQQDVGPNFDGAVDELRVYDIALPCVVSVP